MELKPCPFCGGDAKLWSHVECYGHGDFVEETAVACCKCGAMGQTLSAWMVPNGEERVANAVKAWNRRVGEEENT